LEKTMDLNQALQELAAMGYAQEGFAQGFDPAYPPSANAQLAAQIQQATGVYPDTASQPLSPLERLRYSIDPALDAPRKPEPGFYRDPASITNAEKLRELAKTDPILQKLLDSMPIITDQDKALAAQGVQAAKDAATRDKPADSASSAQFQEVAPGVFRKGTPGKGKPGAPTEYTNVLDESGAPTMQTPISNVNAASVSANGSTQALFKSIQDAPDAATRAEALAQFEASAKEELAAIEADTRNVLRSASEVPLLELQLSGAITKDKFQNNGIESPATAQLRKQLAQANALLETKIRQSAGTNFRTNLLTSSLKQAQDMASNATKTDLYNTTRGAALKEKQAAQEEMLLNSTSAEARSAIRALIPSLAGQDDSAVSQYLVKNYKTLSPEFQQVLQAPDRTSLKELMFSGNEAAARALAITEAARPDSGFKNSDEAQGFLLGMAKEAADNSVLQRNIEQLYPAKDSPERAQLTALLNKAAVKSLTAEEQKQLAKVRGSIMERVTTQKATARAMSDTRNWIVQDAGLAEVINQAAKAGSADVVSIARAYIMTQPRANRAAAADTLMRAFKANNPGNEFKPIDYERVRNVIMEEVNRSRASEFLGNIIISGPMKGYDPTKPGDTGKAWDYLFGAPK
jgi:hypothetical protein